MKTSNKHVSVVWVAAIAAVLMTTGCASTTPKESSTPLPAAKTPTAIAPTPAPVAAPVAAPAPMMLSAAQEVPPNPSAASGKSTIRIAPDKLVTGSIDVTGMTPTMAHIHEAAKGSNGPVIVPFVKTGENTFAPAPGAKVTDAQYASYLAGKLYVNVHSATYPGGEIRLQLQPAR